MIVVLRLGHRLPRDERMTTHVALVARAFGADSLIYSGQKDAGFEESVFRVASNWGGNFSVKHTVAPLSTLKEHKKDGFVLVHLTMYGIPVDELAEKLSTASKKDILIIVGSEHVPPEVYHVSDYNVSVTNQPHSEVAALAIVLDRLHSGNELKREFNSRFGGKINIVPSARGKTICKS